MERFDFIVQFNNSVNECSKKVVAGAVLKEVSEIIVMLSNGVKDEKLIESAFTKLEKIYKKYKVEIKK